MIELFRQKLGRRILAHAAQRIDERVGADDPEHVEPAQCVEGHQAVGRGRLCSGVTHRTQVKINAASAAIPASHQTQCKPCGLGEALPNSRWVNSS
jgi:hypothetical protein